MISASNVSVSRSYNIFNVVSGLTFKTSCGIVSGHGTFPHLTSIFFAVLIISSLISLYLLVPESIPISSPEQYPADH